MYWRFALMLLLCVAAAARSQNTSGFSYVFPLFVDGSSAGLAYRTSIKILPTDAGDIALDCTVVQRQTGASFAGIYGDRYFAEIFSSEGNAPVSVQVRLDPNLPWELLRSTAELPLKSGFATLTCSGGIHPEMQITLTDTNGAKLGETVVRPASEGRSFEFLIDRRDGTRLGFSLANNSPVEGEYTVIARDEFNQEVDRNYGPISAWSQTSQFIDEMLRLPAGFVGRVEIVGVDGGRNYLVGLQFTGGVFTTVPPLVRNAVLLR